MSPEFVLILSPLNVKVGMPIQIQCNVRDTDADLNSFGVRWQGHGLITGSLPANGLAASWSGTAIPDTMGPNYFRCEVWDNAGNGVTGPWQQVNVTPATAAAAQPAVNINTLDPTSVGQAPLSFAGFVADPNAPFVGPVATTGGNTLQTIYAQNDPAAVTPPSGNVAPVVNSTTLTTLTVDEWLQQRPDLVNNWNNANNPQFANDPLSAEIKKFGTLDNYARWTALMDGAGQSGNAPSTAALELYLEAKPDLRANWQNAQAAGASDPTAAYILSYGSLGSYARAAAQANPGAPAAGNQVTTGTTPTGTVTPSATSNGTVTADPAAQADLLKLAIPALTIFAAFFR